MAKQLRKVWRDALDTGTKTARTAINTAIADPVSKFNAPLLEPLLNPDPLMVAPGTAIDPAKPLRGFLKKMEEEVGDNLTELIIKSFSSAILVALNLGEIASITNEVPVLRPLRKAFSPTLPQARDIIDGWRRKIYDAERRDEKLGGLGFSGEDIQALLKVTEFIPVANDIITFAVREVFTPEIRSKFQLDEGIEAVLSAGKPLMDQAGVKPETMRDFWAAHWALPSTLQGFEMLHRDVISESDLDLLLKALDVMPFWRDKLKKIAFSPFTRVDLRRMHKMGVLDESALLQGYKDIGFDAEKAATMVEFTLAFNKDDDDANSRKDKNRDLTKSDVLRIFRDGLMTRKTAEEILTGMAFDPLEIEFLIEREEFLQEEEKLKKTLTALRRGFLDGVFSETDITEKLNAFNLPSKMTSDLLEGWILEKEVQTAIPSKSEILNWFKKGFVDETKTRKTLALRGFRKEDIDIFIKDKTPVKKT